MWVTKGGRGVIGALALALQLMCGGQGLAAEKAKKVEPAKPAASKELSPGYVVKPSDVVPPADVPLGQYLRTIRPFPNWILVCDENRVKKRKVCNISQEILGPSGASVFSWSLAATDDGRPVMILRTPTGASSGTVALELGDGQPHVTVPIYGCNEKLCIAYLALDARLRAAIEAERVVGITFDLKENGAARTESFRAPLAGLTQALSAI
ncbi:invasion associated locus B family protein [Roseixanthobacter liquoris]|uniref:invasion associated locus B family protein n=1 Tax=Roseixanthobacter liquoris TaxID=3119921 RepID=UPI003729968D